MATYAKGTLRISKCSWGWCAVLGRFLEQVIQLIMWLFTSSLVPFHQNFSFSMLNDLADPYDLYSYGICKVEYRLEDMAQQWHWFPGYLQLFSFLKYFYYWDRIVFAKLCIIHTLSFYRTCLAFEDFRAFWWWHLEVVGQFWNQVVVQYQWPHWNMLCFVQWVSVVTYLLQGLHICLLYIVMR